MIPGILVVVAQVLRLRHMGGLEGSAGVMDQGQGHRLIQVTAAVRGTLLLHLLLHTAAMVVGETTATGVAAAATDTVTATAGGSTGIATATVVPAAAVALVASVVAVMSTAVDTTPADTG